MKYIVVLADGMADLPVPQLGGKTPLEYAATPAMDYLAQNGQVGMVQNVPLSMVPGSDVANLSVLGYNPEFRYTGRSPFEAVSLGVDLRDTDTVYRCNLVTLSQHEPYEKKKLLDHSSGGISTEEAGILMEAIRKNIHFDGFSFYTGKSFRHIAVWRNGPLLNLEAPHDHLDAVIGEFLPCNPVLRSIMERSYFILNSHPVNLKRAEKGKPKANSLWFWGTGTRPSLPDFREKTGLRGSVISAVDLLKGIGITAGMNCISVEGANGNLDTNYSGKAEAAFNTLVNDESDFVFIHIEAPDEMGHLGDAFKKAQAIEKTDHQIVSRLCKDLKAAGIPYRMLVLPDHPTPVSLRTHTSAPVPYVLFDSTDPQHSGVQAFSEKEAELTGKFEPYGYKLIERLIR